MLKNASSATRLLISILVALSGLGAIVAGQQFLFLQTEKEMMLARRTLDESFVSAIRVAGGESNHEIAQQLVRRQTSIEGTYSSEAAMIRQLEIRAMADTVAWFVAIVLSGIALTINSRKEHKSGVSPTMPPGAVE